MRRERTAEDFALLKSLESTGILDVFPALQTAFAREKIRCSTDTESFRGSQGGELCT